ncbi:hypothetical protein H4Q26_013773 [Puccinia striiformis f. sp. tritici PST-130]|nr:hypothetical protein H4Q26_013773 [Puccinia striiformis f. sp. tritici PST-130]
MTSDLNHPKRTTSPLSGSLSKKPRAIGKGNDVTDVITNERELSNPPANSTPTNSNLLDRIYPPITGEIFLILAIIENDYRLNRSNILYQKSKITLL